MDSRATEDRRTNCMHHSVKKNNLTTEMLEIKPNGEREYTSHTEEKQMHGCVHTNIVINSAT